MPLPKLLSVRQAAQATGLTKKQILYALERGHISSKHFQKVDAFYVLTEDFEIRDRAVRNDPFLDALPAELTALGLPKDFGKVTTRTVNGNSTPIGSTRYVYLPGYERETKDLSARAMYLRTGVHPNTQKRIKDGKRVKAGVALRLARGLDIDVEKLLK